MRAIGEAAAGISKFINPSDMPMELALFIRFLHAFTEGLLFTRFLTPDLITDEVIISAFEMLARREM